MNFNDFLNHYSLNAGQISWLLGAGASRSSRMPSATDIIWDLKRRHYCLLENQNISDNELSNEAVKGKIQNYLEAAGCPPMWADDEYSYYFELVFGDNQQIQQSYLTEALHPDKISINSGHRILASLIALNQVRVIFTTNFDTVLENAFSYVTGKDLHSFNLEGSYAALDALNSERYPLYAKMHGDFRYMKMKNLPNDLKLNDAQIEQAFLGSCTRFGLVITGYSGRDKNVMDALDTAINLPNAFPKGLFWITSVQGQIYPGVSALIAKAQHLGINAHIIEGDTFDAMMIRIWKMMGLNDPSYDSKIRRSVYENPKIAKYIGNSNYPIIRTNAFPILSMPYECLSLEIVKNLTSSEFKEKIADVKSAAIIVKSRSIYAWGSLDEIHKIFAPEELSEISKINLSVDLENFRQNSQINAFYTRAIARSLVQGKPFRLRKNRGRYSVVIQSKDPAFKVFEARMYEALKSWDFQARKEIPPHSLAGRVPNVADTYWMESAELSLEVFDDKFFLIISPDIWIEPSENRKAAIDFLKSKRKNRFNSLQGKLLDVWKTMLLGDLDSVKVRPFEAGTQNNPEFEICTTTSYSLRSSQ
jgi:hypothetical protein